MTKRKTHFTMVPDCPSGKFWYHDRRAAKTAVRKAQTSGAEARSYYECPLCGGYHITKLTKKKQYKRFSPSEVV